MDSPDFLVLDDLQGPYSKPSLPPVTESKSS